MPKPKKQTLGAALPSLGKILRHFWPHLRQQQGLIGTAFIALLAETAMRLLEPWPLKLMFDRVILPGFQADSAVLPGPWNLSPIALLTGLAIALVLIAALRGMFAYVSAVNMAVAATRIMTDIRR